MCFSYVNYKYVLLSRAKQVFNQSKQVSKCVKPHRNLKNHYDRISFHFLFFQMSSNASNSRRQARRKSDTRIASIVAKAVAKVIPEIVTQVQALSNSQSSANSRADAPKPAFSYKQFKACDPMVFTGEGSISQMLQWFDAIEVTLRQSGCPEHFKTTCATGVLQSRALDWWTAERIKRGNDAAYALSWEELKELMKKEYCPPYEVQKLANEFWSIKQIGSDNAGFTTRFK